MVAETYLGLLAKEIGVFAPELAAPVLVLLATNVRLFNRGAEEDPKLRGP